jgi:hypothetical protein
MLLAAACFAACFMLHVARRTFAQPIQNAAACKGKVAVIERGGCAFFYKAKRAVFAGTPPPLAPSQYHA